MVRVGSERRLLCSLAIHIQEAALCCLPMCSLAEQLSLRIPCYMQLGAIKLTSRLGTWENREEGDLVLSKVEEA